MQYNLFGDPALMTNFISAPRIPDIELDGPAVSLEWTPIYPCYTVEYRDSMDDTWQPVPGTTWPIQESMWTGDDTTGVVKRFYRVIGNAAQ